MPRNHEGGHFGVRFRRRLQKKLVIAVTVSQSVRVRLSSLGDLRLRRRRQTSKLVLTGLQVGVDS